MSEEASPAEDYPHGVSAIKWDLLVVNGAAAVNSIVTVGAADDIGWRQSIWLGRCHSVVIDLDANAATDSESYMVVSIDPDWMEAV